MYCPNCGVEIHKEGSFCAKCKKNIAYLTHPEEEGSVTGNTLETPDNAADDTAAVEENKEAALPKATESKVQEKGYYCNYCGTFVYPEDSFCYDCGKKTRPAYYKAAESSSKTKTVSLVVIFGIIVAAIVFFSSHGLPS